MAEAFGIACHELVSLDFRFGSQPEVQRGPRNVRCWGSSGSQFRVAGCPFLAKPGHWHWVLLGLILKTLCALQSQID